MFGVWVGRFGIIRKENLKSGRIKNLKLLMKI